jgi:sec-independent protein translocase protein TatA
MNLGLPEIMVIFLLALLLFGPRKLPEIGRTLGRAMNEFRRAADELKTSLEREVNLEVSKDLDDIKKDLNDAASSFRDLTGGADPLRDVKSSMRDLANSLDPRHAPPPSRDSAVVPGTPKADAAPPAEAVQNGGDTPPDPNPDLKG